MRKQQNPVLGFYEHGVDGAVAEDGHPEKDKKGWGEEHPHHELPNGPAPGNTRDKHPYEGRQAIHKPQAQSLGW